MQVQALLYCAQSQPWPKVARNFGFGGLLLLRSLRSWPLRSGANSRHEPRLNSVLIMGQAMSFGLTQYDVEDLIRYSKNCFSQGEIEALYQRFRSLDRGHKGYISAEEFMNIPELSINPLAQRLERVFESVNFKEFVYLLSAFSSKTAVDDKIHFIFTVYDSDGDGLVSSDDMELMLRQLAGSTLRDEELRALISRALQQTGVEAGLTREQFSEALTNTDLGAMSVTIDASMY